MHICELLQNELENNKLIWVETKRNSPLEFFKLDPQKEIPEHLVKRIALVTEEEFNYALVGNEITFNFGQKYYPSDDLPTQEYFTVLIGDTRKQKETLSRNPEGYDFSAYALIRIYNGLGGISKGNVDFQSDNLKLFKENFHQPNIFTQEGNNLMEKIFSYKDKLAKVDGIEQDNKKLSDFFSAVETAYKSQKIFIMQANFY